MKPLILLSICLILAIPCQARTIYVDGDAPGPIHNGSSWTDAYNYLQDALGDANSGDEIWVAEGIYTPDTNSADPNGSGDRTATFQLINGVTLKGGYASFGQPDPNSRDIEVYETILSGDLDGNDVDVNDPADLLDEPTRAENSYHVVTGSGTNETAVLDGFIITGGNANEQSQPHWAGGGMYIWEGGGPTLTNCTFSRNEARYRGGGMFNHTSNSTLINCIFSDNHSMGGGGMYNGKSSLTLVNCVFSNNSATGDIGGGGLVNSSYDAHITLINCLFSGNSANPSTMGEEGITLSGGGMFHSTGMARLTNCTFAGNSSAKGNALVCYGFAVYPVTLEVTNCIFWDGGDEIWSTSHSTITITYSEIQDGQDGVYVEPGCTLEWGPGNIDFDPCFADPGFWHPNGTPADANDDFWVDGDYHLKSQAGRWDPETQDWVVDDVTSPCIDAGNPGCPPGSEPTPNGNRINMGAYGGTAEASKTPADWRSIADLTNDWTVGLNDLKVFVDYWLDIGECIPSDLNRSQFVDFCDFAILGQQWSDTFDIKPGMIYHIDDCNMEPGQLSTVVSEPNEVRFSVRVQGRYIHFEDLMYANCCPDELGLEWEINGNQITLYEIGYGGMCDCMCYFPITATLGPFQDGTYTVEVFDNYGQSLGVVEVTIGEPVEPSITYQIEDCNQAASGLFAEEEPNSTRFSVTVEGTYIHFEDMMVANCCPDELGLEMTVEDNLITIYETEYTPGGCWCICDYPITATLGPFEPDTYILEVYEDWGGFIGSTVVTIGPAE
jgi:hypothetical protein